MTTSADLTHGAYQGDVEDALVTAILPYLEKLLDVPAPWDVDNINEDMLARLAETLQADAWTAELGNLTYRRRVVREALLLHRNRGTERALTLFAELAGFTILWSLTRSGSPERNTGIDIYVTPSVFADATERWVSYISFVLERLLPYWLTLNFVSVLPAISGQVRSAGVYRLKGFVWLG